MTRTHHSAMTRNSNLLQAAVESPDPAEVQTVNGHSTTEPLELVRLIIAEWLKLKPDADYHGFGVEIAVRNVMRRFGWVVLTEQAYEELATGQERSIDSQPIKREEAFFCYILDPALPGNIYDRLHAALHTFGWTMMPHGAWWGYVDDEPMSQIEDSRQAAELPVIR